MYRNTILIIGFLILSATTQAFGQVQTVEKKWKNGNIAMKGLMKNGFEHGKWEYFDKTGKLTQVFSYKKGTLEGDVIYYYDNGKIENKGTFKNGLREGIYKEWSSSGALLLEGTYNKNKRDSLWVTYYENGKKKSEIFYKNGKEFLVNYWDENRKQIIENGNGELATYYRKGVKKDEGTYKDSLPHGHWVTWYSNGNKKS
jgi:antitoxin component YwqK of YwqJK toxin-antitoxin module